MTWSNSGPTPAGSNGPRSLSSLMPYLYLIPFAASFVACYLVGGALARLRREAGEEIAAVAGGLALAFGAVLAMGLCVPLEGLVAKEARAVLLGASLVFLACLSEDVGQPRWWLRLGALLLASAGVCLSGVRFEVVKKPLLPHQFAHLGPWAYPITILWLLGVSYVVASTDYMPGLTAGIGTLTALTFFIVTLWKGEGGTLGACLAAVTCGSSAAFLRYGLASRPLALGRSGGAFLGFLLAVITVVGTLKKTAFLVLILPLLALGVPLVNVTYAHRHRRPTPAGKGPRLGAPSAPGLYLYDMLLQRGFTPQRTVLLLLALHAYFCLVALALVGIVTVHFAVKLLLLLFLLPAGGLAFFLISRIAARVAEELEASRTIELLGVKVNAVTMDTTVAQVEEFIAAGTPHHLVTADVSTLMKARQDAELRDIINRADLVTPDGAGVLWTAKVFDWPLKERVPGVDLVDRLCALAAARGYRVYLLGAAPGVAEKAAAILQTRHPGLVIAGTRDGYFRPGEEEGVVAAVRAARPDLLFVALGVPKQEKWIRRHLRELGVPVCIGVGGSFDVISGRLSRAPQWMQTYGLEWLWRVLLEPRRLPRLWALPRFVLAVVGYCLRQWWTQRR